MAHRVFDVTVDFKKDGMPSSYTFTVSAQNEDLAMKKAEATCKRQFYSAKSIEASEVSERTYRV